MNKNFNVAGQFQFAIASTLTAVAKEAQKATTKDIDDTFTVRTNWLKESNPYGIKIKPAKKDDLSAEVRTRAGWLVDHEEGRVRVPQGHAHRVVPTANVRRTKLKLIAPSQKPKNLKSKAFKLPLRKGGLGLFLRKGTKKERRVELLYVLTRQARLRKESTIGEQTVKAVEKNFDRIFYDKFAQALRTAKR